ncbi:CDP-diacylglycerol--glycerol-3-phosphate 3-phosphatidyltransferase [Kosmotoga arenicorallina S304]|uniref:CDP-diacylglycerol--glycerol-3-phosphate 3-phosphatidyltransferase n=1 Tax=Kosmotoga arenicorallina S304 TaxID=1453497 RepID=A0A176K220_9BACT|nr:CDP-diacylglycerol--glycerol-3-phosphate 3-phosphatidyltransferase [Kosmotoga arenicorallina]OAA31236.1 CDP-diacylglycerol--glycerol-3-phosphate 3-phosphatidyltransferase [Kosmotoga arenicorallina S304]
MSIPNLLTLSRIVLTIPLVALLYYEPKEWAIWSFAIFIIASVTDYLDGKLARKLNQVSTLGKFLDQISDKILITSLFLVFMFIGKVNFWLVFLIIFRDTFVSGIRMLAASEGVIIAANYFGKFKTVSQIILLCFLYLQVITNWDITAFVILLQWIVALITLFSGIVYVSGYLRNSERGK